MRLPMHRRLGGDAEVAIHIDGRVSGDGGDGGGGEESGEQVRHACWTALSAARFAHLRMGTRS